MTGANSFWFANTGQSFYNGVATQSLRFAYVTAETWLARTPNAGNRKTHTLSVWVKRSGLSASQNILEARGSGDTGNVDIWFDANDRLEVSGGSTYWRTTARKFRDISSWYHIVIATDTTDGTAADRLKIYVNGTRETNFVDNNHYSQNTDYAIGGNVEHRIGDGYGHFDGYMARYEFIDGTALTPASFGETKNGVWIAKEYTGSYGTNGHKLEFKETGTSANSSGLGADTSGNDNHYTPTQITGTDSNLLDCPENNFATMTSQTFPLAAKGTLREGNLRTPGTDHQVQTSTFAFPASGKWYWEVNNLTSDGSNYYAQYMGVMSSDVFHAEQDISTYGGGNYVGDYLRRVVGVSWIAGNDNYYSNFNTSTISNGANHATWGQEANSTGVLSLALDVDAGTLKYYWNNSLIRTDSTLTANIEYFVQTNLTNSGGNFWNFAYFNFGQDSSFAGTKTAAGNKDANGNGDFFYAVPSGHLALCTANLPEPTIGPNSPTQADDYFNAVTYTGNGGTLSVSGFGFQPDLLWVKSRNIAGNNRWTDSTRGVTNNIISNADDAEKGSGDAEDIDSFDSDGFTVTQASYDDFNDGSDTYVAWGWKANGGTDTASASESGDNPAYNQQANATAGFSIIKYTGTQAAGTIPHGLGAVPKWMVFKNREVDGNAWIVYHASNTDAPETDHLRFGSGSGSNATTDSATRFNDTAPTSSVFTLGADGNINDDGVGCIGYIWAPVEGFSKFSSFIGNGNANGTFVFTGFSPRWVVIKNSQASANWRINDISRQTSNDDGGHLLLVDSNSAEITSEYDIDILSNGFKLRSSDLYENGSGQIMVYMAFAEAPFKYANAR